jgi:hypothetical protein
MAYMAFKMWLSWVSGIFAISEENRVNAIIPEH